MKKASRKSALWIGLILGLFATGWSALIILLDGSYVTATIWLALQFAALVWSKPRLPAIVVRDAFMVSSTKSFAPLQASFQRDYSYGGWSIQWRWPPIAVGSP